MRVSAPTSSKPGLQEKVAVWPTEVPEKATEPLAGSTRIGQRATMEKGVVHSYYMYIVNDKKRICCMFISSFFMHLSVHCVYNV